VSLRYFLEIWVRAVPGLLQQSLRLRVVKRLFLRHLQGSYSLCWMKFFLGSLGLFLVIWVSFPDPSQHSVRLFDTRQHTALVSHGWRFLPTTSGVVSGDLIVFSSVVVRICRVIHAGQWWLVDCVQYKDR